jgi:hypothetical protein
MFSLFRDSNYRVNTLILGLLWSTSAYSFYFTEFYMKYVPVSNVYYLAIMMGFSDLTTSISFNLANRYLPSKRIINISTFFLGLCALTLSIALFATGSNQTKSATLFRSSLALWSLACVTSAG